MFTIALSVLRHPFGAELTQRIGYMGLLVAVERRRGDLHELQEIAALVVGTGRVATC